MIDIRFGEGQGLADKASQSLTQGVVPALHVSSLATFLPHTMMCLLGKNFLVGLPKIAESLASFVFLWNLVPQASASLLTAVADYKGNNLTGATTKGCPKPPFLVLFQHERPEFIEFQHISWPSWQQGVFEIRERVYKFPDPTGNCLTGDVKDAPRPRILARSL